MKFVALTLGFGIGAVCTHPAVAEPNNPAPLDRLIVVATDDMKMSPREYGLLFNDGWGLKRFLEAMEVFPPNSVESIGSVEDLLVDEDGHVLSALIKLGGFMGLGESAISVPWRLLDYQAGERLVVPLELSALERLPTLGKPGQAALEGEMFKTSSSTFLPGAGVWRATDFLQAEYELESGRTAVIRNLVIGTSGRLRAVVVTRADDLLGPRERPNHRDLETGTR